MRSVAYASVPELFDCQLAPWCAQPVDRQQRGYPRPGYIGRAVIHRLLEEAIQSQAPPQFQPQIAGTGPARPFQTNLVHQHTSHLQVVRRRLHMGREQFQLLRFALFIEDLHRSLPARMVGTVEFAKVTQRPLRGPSGVRTDSTSDQ